MNATRKAGTSNHVHHRHDAAPLVNHPAERAVNAGLMRCPDARTAARHLIHLNIHVDLFTHPAARAAFEAIDAYLADGIQPDAATLRAVLDDATLIEVETSLSEHASAANLPVYVQLLKDCQRERQDQKARDCLLKAIQAGRPASELRTITDYMEALQQAKERRDSTSRFVTIGELCALPPAEHWLIKGYLAMDSLSVLFGDPGCGKSFIAMDIAGHVATGRAWRGQAVRQGNVLYIAGEGRNGLAKRFKAWFEQHGEPPRHIQLCLTPIALTEPAGVAALVAEIRAMPAPPTLIILDTINRNFGPGDENATADMTRAIAGLDALRNAASAAIFGLHHSGHADKGRGRGSSVLRASVDVEYAAEKGDRTVRMRCTKAKDSDYPPPLAWTLERYDLPWADADGQPLTSAVLVPEEDGPVARPVTEKIGHQQRRALELLEDLYRQGRRNLEDAGHDPNTARVTLEDWHNAMQEISGDSGNRSRIRRALLDSGHIKVENSFVYQSKL